MEANRWTLEKQKRMEKRIRDILNDGDPFIISYHSEFGPKKDADMPAGLCMRYIEQLEKEGKVVKIVVNGKAYGIDDKMLVGYKHADFV